MFEELEKIENGIAELDRINEELDFILWDCEILRQQYEIG